MSNDQFCIAPMQPEIESYRMGESDQENLFVGTRAVVDDVCAAARFSRRLVVDGKTRGRIARNRERLEELLKENPGKRLYGINTGFADNKASELLNEAEQRELQLNLIRSHSAGVGPTIEPEVVRAALFVRAVSLSKGHSGVRPVVIDALCDLYNSGLVPAVPEIGSVGASGDLAPLSHMTLVLLGEGAVLKDGRVVPVTKKLLSAAGFNPIRLESKEGLALNNGTTFMVAWLSLAIERAALLLDAADLALAMTMEAILGVRHAFRADVQAVRKHPAVQRSAARVRSLLRDSMLCGPNGDDERVSNPYAELRRNDKVQDDYSVRCAPCGHGAAYSAVQHTREAVEAELDSVTDNPLVLSDTGTLRVFSAGHFHGAPIALPADYLRMAICELASVSERRIAKLVDHKRNYGLPNYLVSPIDRQGAPKPQHQEGLESGFMIAQYTAAAVVNELKTGCHPYSVDTIPTGNNAEDYVSMGSNAARSTWRHAQLATTVIASEILAAAQAIILRCEQLDGAVPSPAIQEVIDLLADERIDGHNLVPVREDRPLAPLVQRVVQLLVEDKITGVPGVRRALEHKDD